MCGAWFHGMGPWTKVKSKRETTGENFLSLLLAIIRDQTVCANLPSIWRQTAFLWIMSQKNPFSLNCFLRYFVTAIRLHQLNPKQFKKPFAVISWLFNTSVLWMYDGCPLHTSVLWGGWWLATSHQCAMGKMVASHFTLVCYGEDDGWPLHISVLWEDGGWSLNTGVLWGGW